MKSIHSLIIGTMARCPLCDIYRTLAFRDDELEIEFCNSCLEHVESADSQLNLLGRLPNGHDVNAYGLRRPLKDEVFET